MEGSADPLEAVLEGSADPLEAVLEGLADPLEAVSEGSADPLEADLEGLGGSAELLEAVLEGSAEPLAEELVTDSHGTQAWADAGPDFLEEAWVPTNTDPGPPEARTLDSAVLNGQSEKTHTHH